MDQHQRVENLRVTNAGLVREIEQLGGAVEIATARLEHFTEYLVEEGIISTNERLAEQEGWEQHLKAQLIPVRDRLREAHKKGDQRRPTTKSRLWTPNGDA